MSKLFPIAAILALVACGPGPRHSGDDDDDGVDARPGDCVPTEATETTCNDGFDNDCNGYLDCEDTACFDTQACPVQTCEIETPSVSFPLPDGNCTGFPPTDPYTDAQMQAFLDTCGAYDGVMNLTGFPAGATLTDTSKFLGVCATMEHSWLRDMQMELYTPDGARVILSKFQGQDCPSGPCEVYLGMANDLDDDNTPVPGVGYEYCWKTGAVNAPMIDFVNAQPDPGTFDPYILPAGDYSPSEPFTGLQGATLNGMWKIRIVDAWGIDNGYVFGTKMLFDPSLSDDCPVIE